MQTCSCIRLYNYPLAHPGQKGTRARARSTRSTWERARHLVNGGGPNIPPTPTDKRDVKQTGTMISTFFFVIRNSSLGLDYVQHATLRYYWHWTLGLVLFLLLYAL